MEKQNWRKLNWRKFFRRISWVLSCIAAVVCAGVRQVEIGWEYPLLNTIPQMLLFAVIGFASMWGWYYILRLVKHVGFWIWVGLRDYDKTDEKS